MQTTITFFIVVYFPQFFRVHFRSATVAGGRGWLPTLSFTLSYPAPTTALHIRTLQNTTHNCSFCRERHHHHLPLLHSYRWWPRTFLESQPWLLPSEFGIYFEVKVTKELLFIVSSLNRNSLICVCSVLVHQFAPSLITILYIHWTRFQPFLPLTPLIDFVPHLMTVKHISLSMM